MITKKWSKNFYSSIKTVGVTVLGGLWACRPAETNKSKLSGFCSFRDLSAHTTRLVILIENMYTLWGRKRFLLLVTYFPTNLVYPFTLLYADQFI